MIMSWPAHGAPALLNIDIPYLLICVHQLILMDTNNDSNFLDGFAGSLRDRRTGLDPDPSGADSTYVSGCTPQLEFDAATSITTNRTILISEDLQAASGKGKFQPDNRHGCDKYNDSDDDEWFLGSDEKGKDVYMKHCKVLIQPIAESNCKKF